MYTIFKNLRAIKNRIEMSLLNKKIIIILIMNIIKIKNFTFFLVIIIRAFAYRYELFYLTVGELLGVLFLINLILATLFKLSENVLVCLFVLYLNYVTTIKNIQIFFIPLHFIIKYYYIISVFGLAYAEYLRILYIYTSKAFEKFYFTFNLNLFFF